MRRAVPGKVNNHSWPTLKNCGFSCSRLCTQAHEWLEELGNWLVHQSFQSSFWYFFYQLCLVKAQFYQRTHLHIWDLHIRSLSDNEVRNSPMRRDFELILSVRRMCWWDRKWEEAEGVGTHASCANPQIEANMDREATVPTQHTLPRIGRAGCCSHRPCGTWKRCGSRVLRHGRDFQTAECKEN